MSDGGLMYFAQVGQWEAEEGEIEAVNQTLQELRDEQFRQEIEAKYPQLRATWPGKELK